MVSTWQTQLRKRLKLATLNFVHTFHHVFFSNESFIFYWNNWMFFESVFYIKTVKSKLFKKSKRWKSRTQFCLSLGGYVCENWKTSFLPRLIFNWRTFSRRGAARSSRGGGGGGDQVMTNQNSINRWCQIARGTICLAG